MTKPFFSIIVAVYNVQEFLPQCVESILCQEFDDYELILVDDGSTDASGKICDLYAERNSRVRVIHKSNGGLSSARNAGIKQADGVYTAFVDGDDFLAEDALKRLRENIGENQCDVLLTAFAYYEQGSLRQSDIPAVSACTGQIELINALFSARDTVWQAWRNIVRTAFIHEKGILFTHALTSGEDCAFFLSLCRNNARIQVCPVVFVCYRVNREGSLMSALTYDRFISIVTAYDQWYEYLYNFGVRGKPARARIANAYYYMLLERIASAPELIPEAEKYVYLLEDVTGTKKKFVILLMKIFGVSVVLRLLKLFGRKL